MKLSKEEKKLFSRMGKRGGNARAARLTPEERSQQARHAINARWAKVKKAKKTLKKTAKKT